MPFLLLLGSLRHKLDLQTSSKAISIFGKNPSVKLHIYITAWRCASFGIRIRKLTKIRHLTIFILVNKKWATNFSFELNFYFFWNRFGQVLILRRKKGLCKFQSHCLKIAKKCHFVIIGRPPPQIRITNFLFEVNFYFWK